MLTQVNHGMPRALWDERGPAIRGVSDDRPFQSLIEKSQYKAREAAIAHARSTYPLECCGAFVRPALAATKAVDYVPLRNIAQNPESSFEISAHELAQGIKDGMLQGIHHSHPSSDVASGAGFCPSLADLHSQLEWDVPYYITVLSDEGHYRDFFGWGDQLPTAPLNRREFRSGVHDCFTLYRDVMHHEFGITVPNLPRELDWWTDPEQSDFIPRTMAANGFQIMGADVPLRAGDGLLFSIQSGVVNHCGVYLGHDLFAHHLCGRFSRVDPLPQWMRKLVHHVRYQPNERTST